MLFYGTTPTSVSFFLQVSGFPVGLEPPEGLRGGREARVRRDHAGRVVTSWVETSPAPADLHPSSCTEKISWSKTLQSFTDTLQKMSFILNGTFLKGSLVLQSELLLCETPPTLNFNLSGQSG